MRIKITLGAVLLTCAIAGLLWYVLAGTQLAAQATQFLQGKLPLALALGSLLSLIAIAIVGIIYGFRLEGRLARTGKLHDLHR